MPRFASDFQQQLLWLLRHMYHGCMHGSMEAYICVYLYGQTCLMRTQSSVQQFKSEVLNGEKSTETFAFV